MSSPTCISVNSYILLLLLICSAPSHNHSVSHQSSRSDLESASDGVNHRSTAVPNHLLLPHQQWGVPEEPRSASTCEQTYGLFPCSTTAVGNLFLIVAYGYLMFLAARYLSTGSEFLLKILGPGIVGGQFLPMLGSLPDAMLILVSGLSESKEDAQSQVSVGIGLLAGSTVLILTIVWGTCVIVGKCDIVDSVAVDLRDTRGLSLFGSGVSTDIWTSFSARFMVISVIPFFIVQFPQILNSSSGRQTAVLIGLIVSVLLLISYCLYQIFQPWIQRRKLEYVKHKHVILGILKQLKQPAYGRLLTDDGVPNEEVIKKLFAAVDESNIGYLCTSEIRALIVGIRLEDVDLDHNEAVDKIMRDFDTSGDGAVDEKEFLDGISRFLNDAKRSAGTGPDKMFLDNYHEKTKREYDLLISEDDKDEKKAEGVTDAKSTTIKAILLLLFGTAIVSIFADPLVDAVHNFSTAISIPSFFVSFVALPLATNSYEAVSAIIFASGAKRRTASLTFSELYGVLTINNLLCLSVFLALVYVRGLTWNFSSEVLVILIVCLIIGLVASFHTTFRLWTSIVAMLLYPFSLVLVYVLHYYLGWS